MRTARLGCRVKFRDLRRLLATYDITWNATRGKGSHGAFIGHTYASKIRAVFTLPHSAQKQRVARPYINAIRRKFELIPAFSVSDDKFH